MVGATLDDLTLDERQILNGALAAEIAARDHDAAGCLDECVDVVERLLILDLGNDAGLALLLL